MYECFWFVFLPSFSRVFYFYLLLVHFIGNRIQQRTTKYIHKCMYVCVCFCVYKNTAILAGVPALILNVNIFLCGKLLRLVIKCGESVCLPCGIFAHAPYLV